MQNKEFFKSKKILVTGHTGFKGSWLCKVLNMLGADVTGYALKPNTDPSLFELCGLEKEIRSVIGDIRDYEKLNFVVEYMQPEIIIHMAAQPLVIEGYVNPTFTYATNVMGTVHALEAARNCKSVKSIVNVTTDKVYQNIEVEKGYVEEDRLDGFDPYSNSKSCSELVTACYKRSYFNQLGIAVSTARAGNVIGGGDFAENRIIPDCVRAAEKKESIILRNPKSVRPYQHVLEPIFAYLLIAEKSYEDISLAGSYNIACDDHDCITTSELANLFCELYGEGANWKSSQPGPGTYHEANLLKLDASKIRKTLGWQPRWQVEEAIEKTIEFAKEIKHGNKVSLIMEKQIKEFLNG